MTYPTIVGLIPARGGSRRIPHKNIRTLGGIPLIEWTLRAAKESGIFKSLIVSTDDDTIATIAEPWADLHRVGPPIAHGDGDRDIQWVRHLEPWLHANAFAILRPTSPFRTADTIRRCWDEFQRQEVHSIRAVEPVKQHPGKMWWRTEHGDPLTPVCKRIHADGTPWHSSPTQSLPLCFVQNASLEMAWSYVPRDYSTISGNKIAPFFTEGHEGFDINTEDDWAEAEYVVSVIGLPQV